MFNHRKAGGKPSYQNETTGKMYLRSPSDFYECSTHTNARNAFKDECSNHHIKVPGAHEAIVTEEIFRKANSILKRYKNAGAVLKRHWPFAGKIRCGHCGRALRYHQGYLKYYYCNGARFSAGAGCFEGNLQLEDLKGIVLSSIKAEAGKVLDRQRKSKQAAAHRSENKEVMLAELKKLSGQMKFCERRNIALYEDFADGKIDKQTYLVGKAECNGELARAEARAAELNDQLAAINMVKQQSTDKPALSRVLEADDVTD